MNCIVYETSASPSSSRPAPNSRNQNKQQHLQKNIHIKVNCRFPIVFQLCSSDDRVQKESARISYSTPGARTLLTSKAFWCLAFVDSQIENLNPVFSLCWCLIHSDVRTLLMLNHIPFDSFRCLTHCVFLCFEWLTNQQVHNWESSKGSGLLRRISAVIRMPSAVRQWSLSQRVFVKDIVCRQSMASSHWLDSVYLLCHLCESVLQPQRLSQFCHSVNDFEEIDFECRIPRSSWSQVRNSDDVVYLEVYFVIYFDVLSLESGLKDNGLKIESLSIRDPL